MKGESIEEKNKERVKRREKTEYIYKERGQ
jgi:hypothetical protein